MMWVNVSKSYFATVNIYFVTLKKGILAKKTFHIFSYLMGDNTDPTLDCSVIENGWREKGWKSSLPLW